MPGAERVRYAISLFAGVTSFLALELNGVPYALPLAILVAIFDLIPMIGATLGAALCVLVALFTVQKHGTVMRYRLTS